MKFTKCTGSYLLLFTSVSIAARFPFRLMIRVCHCGLRFITREVPLSLSTIT
jgi:hypothetical protein